MIETADSRGRPMRLSLLETEHGDVYVEVETAGGTSTGGDGRAAAPAASGVEVHPTLSGSMVYLSGSVGPEVTTLELLHQGGDVIRIPVVKRFVLYDVPRERFQAGKRPTVLIGRSGNGDEFDRRKLRPELFGFAETNARRGVESP